MADGFHVTTEKKLARYVATGCILPPVRYWPDEASARRWACKTGRPVLLRITFSGEHYPLPDHRPARWTPCHVRCWERLAQVENNSAHRNSFAEVQGLRRHEGWDGEDARPITTSTCQAAVEFLRYVFQHVPNLPRPFVSASRSGAVALRWVCGQRTIIVRVSAAADGRASYLIGGGGIPPEHGEIDWPGIAECLVRLLTTS